MEIEKEKIVDYLLKNSLFAEINKETLQELLTYLNLKKFPVNTVIFSENETADTFYLIKSGAVDIKKMTYSGKEEILSTLREGEFFGEMAILDEKMRSATAQTKEETEIYIFTKEGVEKIIQVNPSFMLQISRVLVSRLRNADSKISSMEKVEEMNQKILGAQEQERKRIARDVHDGPAQSLAGLIMRCEMVLVSLKETIENENLECLQTEVEPEIKVVKKLGEKSLKEIRNIIFDLHPLTLETQGLFVALEDYFIKYAAETKIKTELIVPADKKNFKFLPRTETTLFSIIQECLNNAKKHSQAKNILVRFNFSANKINVEVRDDGVGFDVQKITFGYENRRSLGLISMQERANLIGGKLTLTSEKNKGTKIEIEILQNK